MLTPLAEPAESLPELRERIRCNRNDAESLHTLGLMLAERGEYRRSLICQRAAASLRPEDARFHYHSSTAAIALGRNADAAWHLDRALSADPNHCAGLQALGRLQLDHFQQPDEALRSLVRAIALCPKDLANYQSAARCMLAAHGAGGALARLREAMPSGVDPNNADWGFASALVETGSYEDAIPTLHDILREQPGDQASMRVLAEVCAGLHDWRGAQAWYERATAAGNDRLTAIWHTLYWSRLGDFERARQIYHLNDLGEPCESLVGPKARLWRGQDIRGKTLRLINDGRYFGDPLQYVRFARVSKELGAHVILQAPRRLLSLLRTVEGVDLAVAPHDRIPALDYDVVAFWLFWELSVPAAEMIGNGPYLQAPAGLRAQWRERIPPTAGVNVGIVWRGSPQLLRDRYRNRTMPLETLRPLAAVPGVALYSLQCGPGRSELLDANPPFPAIDLAPDFPNTAAAMEALDLVVTVDTSIAHLAGALGKRTFLMLPYHPCFRWMANRNDTPWYPATTLFRQAEPGNWRDVVAAVARALEPQAFRATIGGTAPG